ncbi:MAG: DUF3566 domain-containing protein [Pseudonocardiaceae bacterium]
MTRPEHPEPADAQRRPEEPGIAAEELAAPNGAAPSAFPPPQRQHDAPGDADQKTVRLQVGAPEHSRGAVREQPDRQPVGSRAYGFSAGMGVPVPEGATRQMPSPSTVRVGGYTPPERVAPAQPTNTRVHPGRVPRRTSLQLQRLEPWSVLKLSLVLSVAGFLAWMVAVGVLYGVLGGMGVWDQLNGTYSDLTSVNNPDGATELISGGRVFGVALIVGLVNIVLMTALITVGSLIYNIATDLVGGIEVTLSEPD